MHIGPTAFADVFTVDAAPDVDERGFFVRTFDDEVFRAHGLVTGFRQHSISGNRQRGTLRGMHFQASPQGETKLVRCLSGAIFDVVVDVRNGSPTLGKWFGVELSATNLRALYVPEGFAHGFQTLSDDATVLYLIDKPYVADGSRGFAWNDAEIGIEWPILPPSAISARDRALPAFRYQCG